MPKKGCIHILETVSRVLRASDILKPLTEDSRVKMNACCSGIQVVSTVRLSLTVFSSSVYTMSKIRECTNLKKKGETETLA
jgi:hypothetical protein